MWKKVLVIGLFGWSNYSHGVFRELVKKELEFASNDIGLAMFCLGNDEQARSLCPDFYPFIIQAATEPVVFLIEGDTLRKVRFGVVTGNELLAWALAD